ncbi:unnamed protein product [Orchesella dallaii]|uniref:Uncharacterized protein n=1 Tax=Orchesella dallaii TaxID=48710 RepID=A0ABP1Q4K3_9HEXA
MIPILALILAILNSGFTPPPASCVLVDTGSSSVRRLLNSSSTLENLLLLKPSKSARKSSSLKLLRLKYPKLSTLITKDFLRQFKNATGKQGVFVGDIDRGPARMPQEYSSKDYGVSSHYRMKDRKSSKKSFYKSLIQKLLRRGTKAPQKSEHSPTSSYSTKHKSSQQPMSSEVLYSPEWSGGGGWGWGWGKGHGGGGHGHGISLIDLVLCGLSLLSLGGFLLNLLLNLANLFGFGMMTTTATYPVTVTQTATGTGTSTGGGVTSTATGGGLVPGGASGFSAVASRPGTATTTTTTTLPPTETGGTGLTALALAPLGLRRRRPKREIFEPYVDPSTSLETLAKAILNTIGSARHKYECMEELFCENNKKARVVGQWLEYFMPIYSFTLSYIGYARGTHNSLSDHIRAIVLGASETNCHAHYPRCEATSSRSDLDPSPEPAE